MEKDVKNAALKKGDYERYVIKGIGYSQYKQQMAEDLAVNADLKIKGYINLNQRRMYRLEKTYQPSPELVEGLKNIRHKTWWLILTEHWCGDASQTIPVFNRIAELSNGKVEIKLVYRDQNPELMDTYLTAGARAIPKLIQLDTHFNVTGFWGPRPAEAQHLVKTLKSDPFTATGYGEQLHLWYAKDRQKSLEAEISKLLFRAGLYCADCLS